MNENPSISSLKKNGKSILIDWSDGEQSKFNFLWLRDNCPSEVHPTARERTFNLLNVSENIHPKAFAINDKGQLEIEWSEGSHISYYDTKWLRHNCYTMKSKKKYNSPYFLADIEREIFKNENVPTRTEVMENLIPYIQEQTSKGVQLNHIMRHTVGLFHGQNGSKTWKQYLSKNMCIRDADLQKVNHIMDQVRKNNPVSLER